MFVDIFAQAKRNLGRTMTSEDMAEAQRKYGNQRLKKKKQSSSSSSEPVSKKGCKTAVDKKTKESSSFSEVSSKSTKTSSSSTKKSSQKESSKKPSNVAIEDMNTDTELDLESPIVEKVVPTKSKAVASSTVFNVDSSSEDESKGPDDLLREFDEFSRELNAAHRSPPVGRSSVFDTNDDIIMIASITATPSPKVDFTDQLGKMRIRVRFQDKLHQIDGNSSWDMVQVRESLGQLTNISPNELLIYNEQEQKMQDGKSLRSYNIQGGEILEATRRSGDNSAANSTAKHSGMITLKFQKASLKRPITMNVLKKESFYEIRTKLGRELGVDGKLLSFQFDGETIDLSQTPAELDVEDDDAIDVFDSS